MKTKHLQTLALGLACLTATIASVGAADVKANWDKHCASCHAKDGTGNTRMGKKADVKDWTDPKVQESVTDDKAFKSVKEGLTEKGKERMKPYADKVSDEEIKALIAHMRTLVKK